MKRLRCAIWVSLSLVVPGVLAEEPPTLKERLSDKASDDQRVDNCRVPPERRGAKPRPDCRIKTQDVLPDGSLDGPSSPKGP